MNKNVLKLGAIMVAAISLASCASHQIDRQAWRQELTVRGFAINDFALDESAAQKTCAMDDQTLATYLKPFQDDMSLLEVVRTNYKYACPDRMENFRTVVKDLGSGTILPSLACNTPAYLRTPYEAQTVEMFGMTGCAP